MPLRYDARIVRFETPVATCDGCGAEEAYQQALWAERIGLVWSPKEQCWVISVKASITEDFLRWLVSVGWDAVTHKGERQLFCPACARIDSVPGDESLK